MDHCLVRAILLLISCAYVTSKAVFRVTLIHYEANKDDCCDGVSFFRTCNDCDPYFRVCLRQKDRGIESCKETDRENNKHSFDIASSGISPKTFSLSVNTLEKQLGILVVSKDYDAVGGDDDMDSLEYNFFGVSKPRSQTITMQGSQQKYNTRLTVKITISCVENYYGSKCDVFCENSTQSYCSTNGGRFCLPGFVGAYCEPEVEASIQTMSSSSYSVGIPSTTKGPSAVHTNPATISPTRRTISLFSTERTVSSSEYLQLSSSFVHQTDSGHYHISPSFASQTESKHFPSSPSFEYKTDTAQFQTSHSFASQTDSGQFVSQTHREYFQATPSVVSQTDSRPFQATPSAVSQTDSGHFQATPSVVSQTDSRPFQAIPSAVSQTDSGHFQATPSVVSQTDSGHFQATPSVVSQTDSGHFQATPSVVSQTYSEHLQTHSISVQPTESERSKLSRNLMDSHSSVVSSSSQYLAPMLSTPSVITSSIHNVITATPVSTNSLTMSSAFLSSASQTLMNTSPSTQVSDFNITDAVSVNCNELGWDIAVDVDMLRNKYPDLKTSNIYLGKNLCSGFEDGSRLRFKLGLRDCLTSETVSGNQLIYINELIYAVPDPVHSFIIRGYSWSVQVECDVRRNESTTEQVAHGPSNPGLHVAVQRHYSVNISFYKDPNFMVEMIGNPLHTSVGSNVYVKVFTTAPEWAVKLVVHDCYTTISNDSSVGTKFYLIRRGCEKDVNTHVIRATGHETKFMFQDFQYTSSHDGLYLFCETVFCSVDDNSAPCQQKCNTGRKRYMIKDKQNIVSVMKHIVHV